MCPGVSDPSTGAASTAGLPTSGVLQIGVISAWALEETSIHSYAAWMDLTEVGISYSLKQQPWQFYKC